MNRSLRPLVTALCAILLLGPATARAERSLWLESRAGASFSSFLEDPGARQKTGFVGSAALHLGLTRFLTLQTELGYAMKGASYGQLTDPTIEGYTFIGTYEHLYAVDYLELPVLLRARLSGGMVRPHLIVGPVVGWKVLEKPRLNGPGEDDVEGKGHSLRSLDLAAAGGIGFEFGPRDRCVTLEARYTRGFSDILKPELDGTVRNSDVRVALGWKSAWSPGIGQ